MEPTTVSTHSRPRASAWQNHKSRYYRLMFLSCTFRYIGFAALGSVAGMSVFLEGAQAQQPQLTSRVVSGEVRSERLNDRVVRVSGRLLVGLHLGKMDATRFDKNRLKAVLPVRQARASYCLQISSRDGRYSGLVEFSDSGDASSRAELKFSSRFEEDLARFTPQDVATRIIAGDVCDDAVAGPVVPVSSGDTPGPLTALVNPGDATVFARLAGPDGAVIGGPRVRCSKIQDGVRTAFSQSCQLSIPQGWTGGPATLELTVDEIGGTPRTEPISIWLPRS